MDLLTCGEHKEPSEKPLKHAPFVCDLPMFFQSPINVNLTFNSAECTQFNDVSSLLRANTSYYWRRADLLSELFTIVRRQKICSRVMGGLNIGPVYWNAKY